MARSLSRRGFLATIGAAVPLLAAPRVAFAEAGPRTLHFTHTHTGEQLSIDYALDGRNVPAALSNAPSFTLSLGVGWQRGGNSR